MTLGLSAAGRLSPGTLHISIKGSFAMKRLLTVLFVGGCALLGGTAAIKLPPLLLVPAAAQPGTTLGTPATDPSAQLGERFEAVARQVAPAVVAVEAIKPAKIGPNGQPKGKPVEESGSGVIVKMPGKTGYLVLTNNHVVSQAPPDQITIQLSDGRVFRAAKVWTDPESDIALLGLATSGQLPAATLGDSDTARVGQWVLAIGSPFGLNQTVTHGIISARERGQVSLGSTIRIKDFLQTDAAINPGSSGGPLVDMKAEVIGLNTAIASHSGSNSGVGFSIPINMVKRVAEQLLEKGVVSRGYLGMQMASSFEATDAMKLGLDRLQGAWLEHVYAGTPAATAGLKPGDVVLHVDNVAIRDENHLINLISGLPPGQRVRLQVWRDRNVIPLEAVIGDWAQVQNRFLP
jgi:serine protease Do